MARHPPSEFSRNRSRAIGAALVACTAFGHTAHANGRLPTAQHVVVGPGNASTTIILRTTFGLLVSEDSGRTFRWICEDAMEYAMQPWDPAIALDATNRIFVGLADGLMRVSSDRCTYERDPTLQTSPGYVIDLDHDRTGRSIVAITGAGGGAANRVYRSDDVGASFRALGGGRTDVLFDSLEMAPTDTSRVYLTGVAAAAGTVLVLRSDDAGATLRDLPFPSAPFRNAYIAAVDPANADRVFVRAAIRAGIVDAGFEPSGAPIVPWVLLRTDDGGQRWREIARTVGTMTGFAISDDGRTVWYGSPNRGEGLYRSDDGGDSFRTLGAVRVLCLRQHGGVLYVCANHVVERYALGRSLDRGTTIEPLLRFEDVPGAFHCPRASVETSVCALRWPVVRSQLVGIDGGIVDAGGSDAGIDAGGAELERPTGCRCGAIGSAHSSGSRTRAALALVGALIFIRGRKPTAGWTLNRSSHDLAADFLSAPNNQNLAPSPPPC